MVVDLHRHGLGPRLSGTSVLDNLLSYAQKTAGSVVSDKGVKASVVSQAIAQVTGVVPTVDTSDPAVTWVRTTPAHADWLEAVFLKSIKTDPMSKPSDMKIDVMPALTPILVKRVLPVALLGAGLLFGIGYVYGKRK